MPLDGSPNLALVCAPSADSRGAEQHRSASVQARMIGAPSHQAAPVDVPASLLTHKHRQRERLYGAIDNVWNRDDGQHRRELRAILALVDAGQLIIAAAIDQVTELDATTASQLRAA